MKQETPSIDPHLLEKLKRDFLAKVDDHSLSYGEYQHGARVPALKITRNEFFQLSNSGIIRIQKTDISDGVPQFLLFVSFQDQPLDASITESGNVIIHLLDKEKSQSEAPSPGELNSFKRSLRAILSSLLGIQK